MDTLANTPQQIKAGAVKNSTLQMNPSMDLQAPYIEHWVLQLHGVKEAAIDNHERLLKTLQQMVDRLGLTRVSDHTHYFGPGVSSVLILAESHLSVHTWPELGYAHLDIVTCKEKLTAENLEKEVLFSFSPDQIQLVQLEY